MKGTGVRATKVSDGTVRLEGKVTKTFRRQVGDKTADAVQKAIDNKRVLNATAIKSLFADVKNRRLAQGIEDFARKQVGTKGQASALGSRMTVRNPVLGGKKSEIAAKKSDLPREIQVAVDQIFKLSRQRPRVTIEFTEKATVGGSWHDANKPHVIVFDTVTGQAVTQAGSYGDSMFNTSKEQRAVNQGGEVTLKPNIMVAHVDTYPPSVTLYAHPDAANRLALSNQEMVTSREAEILKSYSAYKSDYRKEHLGRMGVTEQEIESLRRRGLISGRNSITNAGRNVQVQPDPLGGKKSEMAFQRAPSYKNRHNGSTSLDSKYSSKLVEEKDGEKIYEIVRTGEWDFQSGKYKPLRYKTDPIKGIEKDGVLYVELQERGGHPPERRVASIEVAAGMDWPNMEKQEAALEEANQKFFAEYRKRQEEAIKKSGGNVDPERLFEMRAAFGDETSHVVDVLTGRKINLRTGKYE